MERQKLLIVDDDQLLQEQLSWSLRDDFDLLQRFDRDGALNAAVHERPDLVLLDMHLPPTHSLRDGLNNISEIRRSDPQTVVIVMTGDEDTDGPLQAVDAG